MDLLVLLLEKLNYSIFLYKAINNLQADKDIEKFAKRKMVSKSEVQINSNLKF